jgi:mono/diheme cytochrome c family protein
MRPSIPEQQHDFVLRRFNETLKDAIDSNRGKAKFEHTCAPCHGDGIGGDGRAMLPGTDALRIK